MYNPFTDWVFSHSYCWPIWFLPLTNHFLPLLPLIRYFLLPILLLPHKSIALLFLTSHSLLFCLDLHNKMSDTAPCFITWFQLIMHGDDINTIEKDYMLSSVTSMLLLIYECYSGVQVKVVNSVFDVFSVSCNFSIVIHRRWF